MNMTYPQIAQQVNTRAFKWQMLEVHDKEFEQQIPVAKLTEMNRSGINSSSSIPSTTSHFSPADVVAGIVPGVVSVSKTVVVARWVDGVKCSVVVTTKNKDLNLGSCLLFRCRSLPFPDNSCDNKSGSSLTVTQSN